MTRRLSKLGVVVIGRNEGERLKRCLNSVLHQAEHVVYVDSGSTDGSVEWAKSLDIEVVNLDMSKPFTMARGRNAGFMHLLTLNPDIRYVQFVDGDCEVVKGWLDKAYETLHVRSDVGVVCGRRHERFPNASIYNRYCDMEWKLPLGEIDACGGDAMMRSQAFQQAQGYNPNMIAGEEAEFCFRIRQQGWKILCLNVDMTLHDAAIHRFRQFWKRNMRTGHAYAERAYMHGRKPEYAAILRPLKSAFLWGCILPVLTVICLLLGFWKPQAFIGVGLLILVYVVQGYRIYRYRRNSHDNSIHATWYAMLCIVLKLPEMIGIFTFLLNQLRGQRTSLIEYKEKSFSRSD